MSKVNEIELTAEEEDMILDLARMIRFLRNYRKLTNKGKRKVRNYMQDLLELQNAEKSSN